jgi:hypothetical protein
MSFLRSGAIVLCFLVVIAIISTAVQGHVPSEMDWLSMLVLGVGLWVAWMLSDIRDEIRELSEKLEEVRSDLDELKERDD